MNKGITKEKINPNIISDTKKTRHCGKQVEEKLAQQRKQHIQNIDK